MAKTLLVVDDKKSLRDLVSDYLTQEGFRVVGAEDGQEALYVARRERPDLILLDIMMPRLSGYDFMREYARESDVPIILLTAKLEESDRVLGLELGADDYVTKPFSLRELAARVRAVLRRAEKARGGSEVLRSEAITLDRASRVVMVQGREVRLTPTEFCLLALLLATPGRVLPRPMLLEEMQGSAVAGMERSIDVHIRNLRMKIEPDPSNPRYIETVFGVGYRFRAETTAGAD